MPTREYTPVETDRIVTETAHPGRSQNDSRMTRYFVVLFAVPLLLSPLPFFLVRLQSYGQFSKNPRFYVLDFAFKTARQNADIVIFGDSSAYSGLDPKQMSAALRAKVLNLPSNLNALPLDDDFALRRYIEADRPPRLIVFYFSPWNFDYGREDFDYDRLYEGMEMLMRHGSVSDVLAFFTAHPRAALLFPYMFYRLNLTAAPSEREMSLQQAQQVTATNGHADSPGVLHARSTCVIPSNFIESIRFDWVGKMGEKYRTPQTQVLFFAAPIPNCTNAQAVIDRSASALPAAPPKTMPASLYVDDNWYSHLYAAGVPQATQSLIDAVRPLLASSTPIARNSR